MAYYEDIVVDECGKISCFLCKTALSDDGHINSHLLSNEHADLYLKRLMIINSIVFHSDQYCCLICNTVIKDLKNHVQSLEHWELMEVINKLVEDDGAYLEIPDNFKFDINNVYCSICDCLISYTIKNVKDHLTSTTHRRARSIAVQPFNGIFSVEGHNEDLWCKICQVYIENYVETIFEHVDEDMEHIQRLKKILYFIEGQNISIDKYLTDPSEDKATCLKCDIQVPCNNDNLERHIRGKRHKNEN